MNRKEIVLLLGEINARWPKFEPDIIKENAWLEALVDLPYQVTLAAVKTLAISLVYPPSIAQVRQEALELINPSAQALTPGKAWELVRKAIRTYGNYRGQEGMESLPEEVRNIVKIFGWQDLCTAEADQMGVIRAQFEKYYIAETQRAIKKKNMPPALNRQIEQLRRRFSNVLADPKRFVLPEGTGNTSKSPAVLGSTESAGSSG